MDELALDLVRRVQPEQLQHGGVGIDHMAVNADHQHPAQRALVDRLEAGQGVELLALGLGLGGAADAFGQDARQQLERLAILLVQSLGLRGAHHAHGAHPAVAGEQRHADVRAVAHQFAQVLVQARVVLGVLDQDCAASQDRAARDRVFHRAAVVEETGGDAAGSAGNDVVAVDQADVAPSARVRAWARSTITCMTCSRSPDAAAATSRWWR
jgi:hypothetical protein